MKNLIEQSYEIDQYCYSRTSEGEIIKHYKTINIEIEDGDNKIQYTFSRERRGQKSYISMKKRNTWSIIKSYWKFYDNNTKFEDAIKRIEKRIN